MFEVIFSCHWPVLFSGDLKRICETDLGIVSQCCLTKHVFRMNKQYLANVALKINVKVGGRNTVLVDALSRRIPLVSDKPTIIFGADVTHPHPGEDSSPSIAAVCFFHVFTLWFIFSFSWIRCALKSFLLEFICFCVNSRLLLLKIGQKLQNMLVWFVLKSIVRSSSKICLNLGKILLEELWPVEWSSMIKDLCFPFLSFCL